jgi:hypothetical protein
MVCRYASLMMVNCTLMIYLQGEKHASHRSDPRHYTEAGRQVHLFQDIPEIDGNHIFYGFSTYLTILESLTLSQ